MGKKFLVVVLMIVIGVWIYWAKKSVTVSETAAVDDAKEVSSITSMIEASNSDGSRKLSGQREVVGQSARYTFTVHDTVNDREFRLFEEVLESGSSMVIPYNSWASDSKYVFLQTYTQTGMTYLVFKSDGSNFSDGLKYLDISKYWMNENNDKVINKVSGWAGPGLLVVYATKPDGSDSFAYWFEVGSRRFVNVREL